MQLNLSFPPSFPSNVAWHPPLIRKARTRCDLTGFHLAARSAQVLSLGRLACWRSSRPGTRGLSARFHTLSLSRAPRLCPVAVDIIMLIRRKLRLEGGWLPINLLIYERRPWTPWYHWLQHQDYQIQRKICHGSPSSVIRIIDEDNQGALHEPLHELGKSCGEIRSCRPECPDHHWPLPHRTAGRKSAGQCKDKPDEEDERLPLQGIQDTDGTKKRLAYSF